MLQKENQLNNSSPELDLKQLLLSLYKLLNEKYNPFCDQLNQIRLKGLHQNVRKALKLLSESFQDLNIQKENWFVISETTIEKIKEDLSSIAEEDEYELIPSSSEIKAEMLGLK